MLGLWSVILVSNPILKKHPNSDHHQRKKKNESYSRRSKLTFTDWHVDVFFCMGTSCFFVSASISCIWKDFPSHKKGFTIMDKLSGNIFKRLLKNIDRIFKNELSSAKKLFWYQGSLEGSSYISPPNKNTYIYIYRIISVTRRAVNKKYISIFTNTKDS